MSFNKRDFFIVLLVSGLFLAGCSQQSSEQLSGMWRSDDAVAGKNLVIEFVPDGTGMVGTGKVFSGSIIGFPSDASFEWRMKGDRITIETVGDDPITQVMTVASLDEDSLSVEVNRSNLTLVRIDDVFEEDLEGLNF